MNNFTWQKRFRRPVSLSILFVAVLFLLARNRPHVALSTRPFRTLHVLFEQDDVLICDNHPSSKQLFRQRSLCRSWSPPRNAKLSTGRVLVTYVVHPHIKGMVKPNDIVVFLQRFTADTLGNISIVVTLETDQVCSERQRANAKAHEDYFRFAQGTCAWWQLILSATGFQVQRSADYRTIVAKPLSKQSCGCACDAVRGSDLPQPFERFVEEFGISLTAKEQEMAAALPGRLFPPDLHESCAVVFSSGVLNIVEPPLGNLIDTHEAVFRMNHAPPGGQFAHKVGNKSTYRVAYVPEYNQHPEISPPGVERIDNATLLLSVHYKDRAKRVLEYNLTHTGVVPTRVRREGSKCVLKSFFEHPLENKKPSGPHLSQGLVGLLLSLHMCRKTVIFGSVLGTSKQVAQQLQVPFHYHEKLHDRIFKVYSSVHGAFEEHEFLSHLLASGTVSYVPGEIW